MYTYLILHLSFASQLALLRGRTRLIEQGVLEAVADGGRVLCDLLARHLADERARDHVDEPVPPRVRPRPLAVGPPPRVLVLHLGAQLARVGQQGVQSDKDAKKVLIASALPGGGWEEVGRRMEGVTTAPGTGPPAAGASTAGWTRTPGSGGLKRWFRPSQAPPP